MKNSEPRYYKPDISEFHVGFEHERNWHNRGKWTKATGWQSLHYLRRAINAGEIRVKCLDAQDIISLGFILLDDYDDLGQATFEKGDWFLVWTRDVIEVHRDEDMLFCGKVKNRSELKTILKQVGYEMDNSEVAS